MNSRKAKRLLAVYRPGGADDNDPRFAQALRQAERDPGLGRWWHEQKEFDRRVADDLQAISPPADLKATLLSRSIVQRPSAWWQLRTRLALAACFLALAIAGGFVTNVHPDRFPEFRHRLTQEIWAGDSHLDFKSSNLLRVRQWLAAQGVTVNLSLPQALRPARLVGCRLVESDGRRVPVLCLVDGPRHLHLVVADNDGFKDLPAPDVPEFERCGPWKTASWQQRGAAYVLVGMNNQTFVSRFRKAGRWVTANRQG